MGVEEHLPGGFLLTTVEKVQRRSTPPGVGQDAPAGGR